MGSDTFAVEVMQAAHMKLEHGYSWRKLKAIYPGRGEHFWVGVRRRIERIKEA